MRPAMARSLLLFVLGLTLSCADGYQAVPSSAAGIARPEPAKQTDDEGAPQAFAWQRTDKYVAPDFEAFFPDDPVAGKTFDAVYRRLKKGDLDLPDQEVLQIVRNGLRRTKRYKSEIFRMIGNRYVKDVRPQNPQAIEIMYHASDPRTDNETRFWAMYHGLSVLEHKPPNVLKRLIAMCMAGDHNYVWRVAWGCKTQKEGLRSYLQPYLDDEDAEVRERAAAVDRHFKGEEDFKDWRRKKYLNKLRAQYAEEGAAYHEFERSLEPYAWQRTDRYVPPDFEGFFPDDPEAGKRLDELHRKGTKGLTRGDVLMAVWNGLRRAEQRRNYAIKLAMTSGPYAAVSREIVYHAMALNSQRQIRDTAIYSGYGFEEKSPNVLRAFVEICLKGDRHVDVDRIVWACESQMDEFRSYVRGCLQDPDPEVRESAAAFERHLDGDLRIYKWKLARDTEKAKERYAEVLPVIRRQLAEGDSKARKAALRRIWRSTDLALAMDRPFLEACKACADDLDPHVRKAAAGMLGGPSIRGSEPERDVIEVLLRLARDEDPGVREAVARDALSRIRPMDEAVVQGFLEVMRGVHPYYYFNNPFHDEVIRWLEQDIDNVIPALERLLGRYKDDPNMAVAAFLIYEELMAEEPPGADRFDELGSFLLVFDLRPGVRAKELGESFLEASMAGLLEGAPVRFVKTREGFQSPVPVVDGIAGRRDVIRAARRSPHFRLLATPPLTPELSSYFFGDQTGDE